MSSKVSYINIPIAFRDIPRSYRLYIPDSTVCAVHYIYHTRRNFTGGMKNKNENRGILHTSKIGAWDAMPHSIRYSVALIYTAIYKCLRCCPEGNVILNELSYRCRSWAFLKSYLDDSIHLINTGMEKCGSVGTVGRVTANKFRCADFGSLW